MLTRLKVGCPFCGFTRFVKTEKTDKGLLPAPFRSATLPDIQLFSTTNGERGRLVNHMIPIEELHGNGGEYTERAILEQTIAQANAVMAICEQRISEL